MKYYLFGGMSAAFLLFGFSYLYGITGSTNLQQVMQSIHHCSGPSYDPLLLRAPGDDRRRTRLQGRRRAIPSVGAGHL